MIQSGINTQKGDKHSQIILFDIRKFDTAPVMVKKYLTEYKKEWQSCKKNK